MCGHHGIRRRMGPILSLNTRITRHWTEMIDYHLSEEAFCIKRRMDKKERGKNHGEWKNPV
jgi:hypothetical protein